MNNKVKLSLLSAASLLTLAACGNGGQEATDDTQDQMEETTETTDQADESMDETADESADQTDDMNDDDQATDDQAADTPGIENMEFAVSLDQALETFKTEVGDDAVQITEVAFDTENGNYAYGFTGFSNGTEYEMKIDAETGDVFDSESEPDDLDDDVLDLTNVVDPQEAMAAALEAAGSGYVSEWELDVENGTPVYEIDLENANDVVVNAETGEVF